MECRQLASPRRAPPLACFSAARVACYTHAVTSILGEVFDVSNGAKHYGKGGAYEGFAGKDASRSFVSGDFTEVGVETGHEYHSFLGTSI